MNYDGKLTLLEGIAHEVFELIADNVPVLSSEDPFYTHKLFSALQGYDSHAPVSTRRQEKYFLFGTDYSAVLKEAQNTQKVGAFRASIHHAIQANDLLEKMNEQSILTYLGGESNQQSLVRTGLFHSPMNPITTAGVITIPPLQKISDLEKKDDAILYSIVKNATAQEVVHQAVYHANTLQRTVKKVRGQYVGGRE